jgi:hypothetical protein
MHFVIQIVRSNVFLIFIYNRVCELFIRV